MTGAAVSVALVLGVGAGLDLYLLTACLVGLAMVDPSGAPQGLGGLGSWILLAPALVLYGTEAVMERRSGPGILWRQVHVLVRAAGAATLALLLLDPLPPLTRGVAAGGACLLALALQVARTGRATLTGLGVEPPRRWAPWVEDVAVVALAVVFWRSPELALVAAAVPLALATLAWPTLASGFRLSARLVRGRLRGLVVRRGWRSPVGFPSWMKARLAPGGVVTGGRLRGTPSTLIGPGRTPRVQSGWLVVRGPEPTFAHRTLRGVERLELAGWRGALAATGPLGAAVLRLAGDDAATVVVAGDGPGPGQLAAELEP